MSAYSAISYLSEALLDTAMKPLYREYPGDPSKKCSLSARNLFIERKNLFIMRIDFGFDQAMY